MNKKSPAKTGLFCQRIARRRHLALVIKSVAPTTKRFNASLEFMDEA
jgi:hypothetical protein